MVSSCHKGRPPWCPQAPSPPPAVPPAAALSAVPADVVSTLGVCSRRRAQARGSPISRNAGASPGCAASPTVASEQEPGGSSGGVGVHEHLAAPGHFVAERPQVKDGWSSSMPLASPRPERRTRIKARSPTSTTSSAVKRKSFHASSQRRVPRTSSSRPRYSSVSGSAEGCRISTAGCINSAASASVRRPYISRKTRTFSCDTARIIRSRLMRATAGAIARQPSQAPRAPGPGRNLEAEFRLQPAFLHLAHCRSAVQVLPVPSFLVHRERAPRAVGAAASAAPMSRNWWRGRCSSDRLGVCAGVARCGGRGGV